MEFSLFLLEWGARFLTRRGWIAFILGYSVVALACALIVFILHEVIPPFKHFIEKLVVIGNWAPMLFYVFSGISLAGALVGVIMRFQLRRDEKELKASVLAPFWESKLRMLDRFSHLLTAMHQSYTRDLNRNIKHPDPTETFYGEITRAFDQLSSEVNVMKDIASGGVGGDIAEPECHEILIAMEDLQKRGLEFSSQYVSKQSAGSQLAQDLITKVNADITGIVSKCKKAMALKGISARSK